VDINILGEHTASIYLEEGGSIFVQNIGADPPDYMFS
jgi:hypothetical protein